MTYNFGRLSPIFTNNSELWPVIASPVREEEMDIDTEQMAISQQCQRFEREMVWSPVHRSDESENNCEMPSQDSGTVDYEPRDFEGIQPSPDMFVDSEEGESKGYLRSYKSCMPSSDVIMSMCGQKFVPSERYRIPEMNAESMECSQPIQSVHMTPDNTFENSVDDVVQATLKNTPTYSKGLNDRFRSNLKIHENTMVSEELSFRNSLRISSTPIMNPEGCIEYEVQPTPEEVLAFRQRQILATSGRGLGNSSRFRAQDNLNELSPIYTSQAKRNAIVASNHGTLLKANRSKSIESRFLECPLYMSVNTNVPDELDKFTDDSSVDNHLRSGTKVSTPVQRKFLKARRSKSTELKALDQQAHPQSDQAVLKELSPNADLQNTTSSTRKIIKARRSKSSEPKSVECSFIHKSNKDFQVASQKVRNILKARQNTTSLTRKVIKAKRSKSSEPKLGECSFIDKSNKDFQVASQQIRHILKAMPSNSTEPRACERPTNTNVWQLRQQRDNRFCHETSIDLSFGNHSDNGSQLEAHTCVERNAGMNDHMTLDEPTEHETSPEIEVEPPFNDPSYGQIMELSPYRSVPKAPFKVSSPDIKEVPIQRRKILKTRRRRKTVCSEMGIRNEEIVVDHSTNEAASSLIRTGSGEIPQIDTLIHQSQRNENPFLMPKILPRLLFNNVGKTDDDTFCSELERSNLIPELCFKENIAEQKTIQSRNRLLESLSPPHESLLPADHFPTVAIPSNGRLRNDHRRLSFISLQSKSSDRTYCSPIEQLDQQKRCDESEIFDLYAAIRNIMHLQADPVALSKPAEMPPAESDHPMPGPSSQANMFVESPPPSRSSVFMSKVEAIVMTFLLDLMNCNDEAVSISVKNVNWSGCVFETDSQTLSQSDGSVRKTTCRHKIMIIMKLLSEIYSKLKSGKKCTKRELYYDDPELFQDMQRMENAFRDASNLIGALPWELGILSTSKGLMSGPLVITLASDERIDCVGATGGIILPHLTTGIKSITTTAELVLLVEKDTVYEQLLNVDLVKHFGRSTILITGKGYPDINTRVMLHKIWSCCRLPIYALFDADPHGIDIMLIYQYGSMSLSPLVDHLAVPHLQWIGVRPSEIAKLGLHSLPMTGRDQRKVHLMLQRPYITEEIRRELQVLLNGERKAEIESLTSVSRSYLVDAYLPERLTVDVGFQL